MFCVFIVKTFATAVLNFPSYRDIPMEVITLLHAPTAAAVEYLQLFRAPGQYTTRVN